MTTTTADIITENEMLKAALQRQLDVVNQIGNQDYPTVHPINTINLLYSIAKEVMEKTKTNKQ